MIQLAGVDYLTVSKYFWEFQKKSKCFELPPEEAEFIGIYQQGKLIGYFVTVAYDTKEVEIHQGYLLPKYRHLNLSKECTNALEQICKKAGFKKMLLGTHNRFRSYLKFAKSLGYTPKHLTFVKEI